MLIIYGMEERILWGSGEFLMMTWTHMQVHQGVILFFVETKIHQELNSTGAISLMLAFMHLSFVILGCCWLHSLVWSSISRLKPKEKVTYLCLSRKYSNTARIDADECVRAKKVLLFTLSLHSYITWTRQMNRQYTLASWT